MKALSIKQPWAWLIVNGHKDIENRTWTTTQRGPIFIHAGKSFDKEGYEWVKENFPEIDLPKPDEFERGGLVGIAHIKNCVSESASKWFFGPYGFTLTDARPIELKPYRGQLGFFNVDQSKTMEPPKEEPPKKVSLFSNGTEVMMWKDRNCDMCRKGATDNGWRCSVERDIDIDGEVPQHKAKKIGYKPHPEKWECALKDSIENPSRKRKRTEKKNDDQLELGL